MTYLSIKYCRLTMFTWPCLNLRHSSEIFMNLWCHNSLAFEEKQARCCNHVPMTMTLVTMRRSKTNWCIIKRNHSSTIFTLWVLSHLVCLRNYVIIHNWELQIVKTSFDHHGDLMFAFACYDVWRMHLMNKLKSVIVGFQIRSLAFSKPAKKRPTKMDVNKLLYWFILTCVRLPVNWYDYF